jgi:hypothetical protein
MSKQIRSIVLANMGLFGLDTQSSPATLSPLWLSHCTNIAYTEGGKLTFRKGLQQRTLKPVPLLYVEEEEEEEEEEEDVTGIRKEESKTKKRLKRDAIEEPIEKSKQEPIGAIIECCYKPHKKLFCSYGNKIFDVNLDNPEDAFNQVYTPKTEGGGSDWQFQDFNHTILAFQQDEKPLIYDKKISKDEGRKWKLLEETEGYEAPTGVKVFNPSCGLGYYGRGWVGGVSEDDDVMFYSNLLNISKWGDNVGDSGLIDLKSVWGRDVIVAIHPFAGKLAIFGKKNIILYNNPNNISKLALDEVIEGIGCCFRDSIQAIGDDLYFLSNTGVRSLQRTAVKDKLPLMEKSLSIRDEIISHIILGSKVKSVYAYNIGLYLLSFIDKDVTYVFDIQAMTDRGSPRISKWVFSKGMHPSCLDHTDSYGFLIGLKSGNIASYGGHYDKKLVPKEAPNGDVNEDKTIPLGKRINLSEYKYENIPYTGSLGTTWMQLNEMGLSSILKQAIIFIEGGRNTKLSFKLYKDFETYPCLRDTYPLTPFSNEIVHRWGEKTSVYTDPAHKKEERATYAHIYGLKEHLIPLTGDAKRVRMDISITIRGYNTAIQTVSLLFKEGKIS